MTQSPEWTNVMALLTPLSFNNRFLYLIDFVFWTFVRDGICVDCSGSEDVNLLSIVYLRVPLFLCSVVLRLVVLILFSFPLKGSLEDFLRWTISRLPVDLRSFFLLLSLIFLFLGSALDWVIIFSVAVIGADEISVSVSTFVTAKPVISFLVILNCFALFLNNHLWLLANQN